jgi:YtoQ family protein
MAASNDLTVYLAGHIHGDWRDQVRRMAESRGLSITFLGPCEDHGLSDSIGVKIRGITKTDVGEGYFSRVQDDLGGKVNDLRTRVGISRSDIVIAFFDEDQGGIRQWNTSGDIGEAAAHGKPVIVVHGPGFTHSLKEVDGRANVVVDSLEQAVEVLAYVCGD